jgi:hypothetical protein
MPRQENRDGVFGATISNAPAPPVERRDGVLEASWLLSGFHPNRVQANWKFLRQMETAV